MDDKASTEKIEKTAPLPSPEAHPAEQSDQVAAAMGQQAMPSWQSAVRDAYLARAAVSASAEAGGAAQADPSTAVSIRDAYMARLGAGVTEVADAGASRDYLLRSVYAARSGSVREGASDARRRATPKKTRAARKKARKAARTKIATPVRYQRRQEARRWLGHLV